jgi:hypothetical protein
MPCPGSLASPRLSRARCVWVAALLACPVAASAQAASATQDLPDAPSALLFGALPAGQDSAQPPAPCPAGNAPSQQRLPVALCEENPIQPIVTSNVRPLSSPQKAQLAVRDIVDPFNIIVITGAAGLSIMANAHSAYGPGLKGWGKLTGYSFIEDAQGEFFGTYAIPSLVHEDPRYHRMPNATFKRRLLHAVAHTAISQHDDGRSMLNYATLLTYPISAGMSNLYVPGIATDAPSTARRIGLGLVTDPIGNIVAEFLPDVARHIHVRVVFMQQILNEVANGAPDVL